MIARACSCGGVITDGHCSRCTRKKRVKHAKTSGERGYDYRWQKTRKAFLRRNPLCVDCRTSGIVTEATQVHHIRKIKDRPDLRLNPENLMALCEPCHTARTARGE